MVTPDELETLGDKNGRMHLRMTCYINDKLISDGNTNDLYHLYKDDRTGFVEYKTFTGRYLRVRNSGELMYFRT